MQIASIGDNSHEISNHVSMEKRHFNMPCVDILPRVISVKQTGSIERSFVFGFHYFVVLFLACSSDNIFVNAS